jgi:cell division protein FtsI/penicillin-binding protein 2
MRWDAQTRAVTVCFGLVAIFSAYSYRLIYLQVIKHDDYTALAAEKHVHKQIIHARRGIIRDCHRESLADNLPVRLAIADGSHIRDPVALAQAIAAELEMDPGDLADKLTAAKQNKKEYVVLKKKEVSEETADRVRKIIGDSKGKLRGIYFDPDFVRVYPNGPLLAQVIGFLDHEHKGKLGIEMAMQEFLQGTDGYRYSEQDRTGRELVQYRGHEKAAKNGCDVVLTVDLGLQTIVEQELDAAWAEYQPKMATAIMVRPQTGEILAIASRPTFDCNNIGEATDDAQKNRPIVDMIEPGSTFKIVATSAALEEKLVTPDTTIFCENGHFQYAGRVLRDAHPMGVLTVHQILSKSSNIGAAKLALQLGESRFYQYIRLYGFGERTGICLPGEIPGLVNPPYRWSKLDITRIPMGQSVAVTPLQMVIAMSVVANGGNLLKPMIVSQIVDSDGRTVANYSPEIARRVISTNTAQKVVAALKDVVSKEGTAQGAAVPGFAVAGKTGTAQKIDPKGGYMEGRYVVSFVGFMPADDPKFTLLVLLDDPVMKQGKAFGGTVAGPIFAKIAKKVADYLDLQPTEPTPPPDSGAESKKVVSTLQSHD